MQLLLEAPITPDQVNKFLLPRDNQVSIFYDKKWLSVEPVRVQEIDGEDYLIAFEVSNPQATTPVRYELKKITNWNVLSKKSADRAKKEKEKEVVKIKAPGGDKIKASIVNKRVVSFNYKGDKENEPGVREKVAIVAEGTRKGRRYIRAYQKEGATYRGNLPTDNKEYRPMPGWRFFRVDRIDMGTYKEIGDNFYAPGTDPNSVPKDAIIIPDNYNPSGDRGLTSVNTIVKFNESNNPPITKGKKKLQENKIISAILEAVRIL